MSFHRKTATTTVGAHRQLRRVPADWNHPKNASGTLVPLFQDLELKRSQEIWDRGQQLWDDGFYAGEYGRDKPKPLTDEQKSSCYSDWVGNRPEDEAHMPLWPDEKRTHYQLYETSTEGTPISPVMDSLESLAKWLGEQNEPAYADLALTEKEWLETLKELEEWS